MYLITWWQRKIRLVTGGGEKGGVSGGRVVVWWALSLFTLSGINVTRNGKHRHRKCTPLPGEREKKKKSCVSFFSFFFLLVLFFYIP